MAKINVDVIGTFLMSLAFLTSCSHSYHVEGSTSVVSLDGKMLYLKTVENGELVSVDSAEVIHGLFKMKGNADSVRMVTLYMDDESLMPLVLESGKVKVSIMPTGLEAKGTPLNNKLYDFIEKRNAFENSIEELERKEARMVLEGVNIDEIHDSLRIESENKAREMDEYIKQFIISNFDNVLGTSVFMMICSTMPYPLMTPVLEDIISMAPSYFKEDSLVKDFVDKARENMKLIEENKRLQENISAQAW